MVLRVFFLHRSHFGEEDDQKINILPCTIFDFLLPRDLIFVHRIHDVVLWDAENSYQILNVFVARILHMNPISRFPILRLRVYPFIR
ncbi:hypothetical protein SDC9_161762 [bioreactor metagenome]|uniref:Uncharacterized protein n=1 Tax=bioreactor metagenome TaxID=1076179 RepID=A0A645FJ40_9ZZZZ